MPVFAENVSLQQTSSNGKTTMVASGKFTDGKRLVGFHKESGRKAKFFAIPDIRKLFLVSPTKKNLAGRLQSLLHPPKYKKSRRRPRRRKKQTRSHRQQKHRRTRRKRKRSRKL
tara:strand:+ start:3372 stop:3713 length:342 start_codon:yes stop_codon:yes gene_type:complete